MSVQSVAERRDFAARVAIGYRLISDPRLELAALLGLPTFDAGGRAPYVRLAIVNVLYPVTAPERNADDVLDWLGQSVGDRI